MKSFKNLIVILALSPVVVLLLTSTLNLNTKHQLKILNSRTPQLHLGTLLTISTSLGFVTSFIFIKSLTLPSGFTSTRRIIRTEKENYDLKSEPDDISYEEEILNEDNKDISISQEEYISRDPRDPYPTITIPYTVRKVNKNNSPRKKTTLSVQDRYNNDEFENAQYNSINIKEQETKDESNDWNFQDLENW